MDNGHGAFLFIISTLETDRQSGQSEMSEQILQCRAKRMKSLFNFMILLPFGSTFKKCIRTIHRQ